MLKKLSIILILIATILLRIHVLTLLCILISTGNFYADFVLHIILSVLVTLKSHWFYNYMLLHKHQFYLLTRYFVNNYTPERYRDWKKYGMLSLSMYLILIFCLVDINSNLLIIYTVQNLIIYWIIDIIEHDKFMKFIESMNEKPKHIIYGELNIIDDYCTIDENQYRVNPNFNENDYIAMGNNNDAYHNQNNILETIDQSNKKELDRLLNDKVNRVENTKIKHKDKKKGKIEFLIVDDLIKN